MNKVNVNEGTELLKEAGLKVTPARLAVFSVFKRSKKPISAEQVFARLKGQKVDLVTVYRVIKVLSQFGMIKRVDLRRNSAFYEFSDKHQHRIVCLACGQTENLGSCLINEGEYRKIINKSEKFKQLRDHSLEIFGLCEKCSG